MRSVSTPASAAVIESRHMARWLKQAARRRDCRADMSFRPEKHGSFGASHLILNRDELAVLLHEIVPRRRARLAEEIAAQDQ
jgi:hypothetical protein